MHVKGAILVRRAALQEDSKPCSNPLEVAQFTFADRQERPSGTAQPALISSITLAIPLELRPPISEVRRWDVPNGAAGVRMPKAAVHKDDLLIARKNKTKSGLPGNLRTWSRYRLPMAETILRTIISGPVFFALIRAISAERRCRLIVSTQLLPLRSGRGRGEEILLRDRAAPRNVLAHEVSQHLRCGPAFGSAHRYKLVPQLPLDAEPQPSILNPQRHELSVSYGYTVVHP
jgi:hypothetical protein